MKRKIYFSQKRGIRYLALFSGTFLLLFVVFKIAAQKSDPGLPRTDSYNLTVVTDAPVYPGCEYKDGEFLIRRCLSESMTSYFLSNFDFDVLPTIDSHKDIKRAYMAFEIDEFGNIASASVHGPESEDVKQETLRVLDGLPMMVPANFNGKTVSVKYFVLINIIDDKIEVLSGPSAYRNG